MKGNSILTILVMFLMFGAICIYPPSGAGADMIPRPEHPFPQAERQPWLNLNGTWEFAETDDNGDAFLDASHYPDRITVPFCRESKLSGLERRGFVKNVWYRRAFSLPSTWDSPRTLLHIGACDWRTRLWVNGTLAGTHVGGSAAFAFDITPVLQPGENTIIIHAFDDTRSGLQACGKQSEKEESYGCLYTRTTGVWQTVWLEGVGKSYISDFSLVPDPAHSRLLLQADVEGSWKGLTLRAEAFWKNQSVGKASAAADWRNNRLTLDLSEKHLWSVKTPNLYDLTLTLEKDGKPIDAVRSYFGLRTVSIEGRAILINGEPVFQRLVLDQGFYPDGIWTAPSEEALRSDIELSQAAGFNGARLHQKVFEPRFLYWADKLGYLVWGEFPNWGLNYENPQINLPVISEWVEILRRDRNHPAIVGWCPFNETPPSAGELQARIAAITLAADPTRPLIESSGYAHTIPHPQVLDAHDYNQDPPSFRSRWMDYFSNELGLPARYGAGGGGAVPFFVSEYGGIGWFKAGDPAWGYGNNPKTLEELYQRYEGLTNAQLDNRNLFGFCYTQLTDIEQERNGVYYYDRSPKFDVTKLRSINERTARYETDPPLTVQTAVRNWKTAIGALPDADMAHEWRFITEKPGDNWAAFAFDDSGWKSGFGGFGKKGGWEERTRTPWESKDIWLRQQFTYDSAAFDAAALVIHYDNATQIYLNGKLLWKGEGWNDAYAGFDITQALREAIQTGKNVIAVHCHQDEGGQFIDLALLLGSDAK
ncbi:MAG: sugar-binding domain-containing protein [Candidatus Omnitrophota bacterium]